MATKLGSNKQPAVADQELDPKFEWQENAANFVLRVHLSGFRKEDFRVQVDGAGRLTVRGQRAADGGGKLIRFHKVFQLPPSSNLDDISGRFDGGVLALTVPKRPAPPLPTVDDRTSKPAKQADEAKAKEDKVLQESKDEVAKKKPAEEKQHEEEAEAKKKLAVAEEMKHKEAADAKKKPAEETKHKAAAETRRKEETKAEQRTEATQKPKEKIKDEVVEAPKAEEQVQKPGVSSSKEEGKQPKAPEESLLERVRRCRAEEERAKAEEEERKKVQQSASAGGWKQRVAEELQGLRGSEWAEGLVDTVKRNKEVIAAAVAAFSLGLFVSSRLCSRN